MYVEEVDYINPKVAQAQMLDWRKRTQPKNKENSYSLSSDHCLYGD